ncbi:RmlC-like cupin [Cryphonectria parasitica EP155]|uniref:RmlC-like cupin n=1 Tax=Cryphonectria parasitica (strain ATCC 38755 / EP155) TaxID=660469 RepID=A0A9P5CN59_CRYP1|nr:RmlC-like cupin [Cryphonectria parasitica EP155]KAF3763967.1 RmlC-like cupin [Cryphonectria parasitica EP155]
MPPTNSKSDAPYANVTLVRRSEPAANETFQLGGIRLDILEDGRNTDRRLSAVRIFVPPRTPGPAQHWHQMHDETFLVEKGTATFTSREDKITAREGDYVVVPTCSPHTFANDSDEELVMYNTFTPAFYIDYFRLMAKMVEESDDGKLSPKIAKDAMDRYATLVTGATSEW